MYLNVRTISLFTIINLVIFKIALAEELNFISYNVNSDRRVELLVDGQNVRKGIATDSHENWSFENRAERLAKQILAAHPDIVCLQEMDIRSVEIMQKLLASNGYKAHVQAYNETDGAFRFITAFKKDRFKLIHADRRYFNVHPDKATVRPENYSKLASQEKQKFFDENFGEEFERPVHLLALNDGKTGKSIFVANNHFGLRRNYRMKSAELLAQFLDEFQNTNHADKDSVILVSGDFNAFPDDGGFEQMQIIEKAGYDCLSKGAKFFDGSREGIVASGTISMYPYDFGILKADVVKTHNDNAFKISEARERRDFINEVAAQNIPALGGILDFIFGRNISSVRKSYVMIQSLLDGVEFDASKLESEGKYLKDFIIQINASNVPAFPSDHFMMFVILDI